MPCKQSELITAINSFAAARSSNDQVLTSFSANLVAKLMETLVFDPEDEVVETPEEAVAPQFTSVAESPHQAAIAQPPKAPVLKDPPVKKTKRRTSSKA